MAVRIGELLLKEKRITLPSCRARNYQKAHGGKLGFNLIKLGFVQKRTWTALLSRQYGVPSSAWRQFRDRPRGHKLVRRPRPAQK